MAVGKKRGKNSLRSKKIKERTRFIYFYIQPVFRIRDFLRRIRITGFVHWITDPALFVFSAVVLLHGCREKEEKKLFVRSKERKERVGFIYVYTAGVPDP